MMKSDSQFDQNFPELAERVATRLLGYPWKIWFWGDSIGLEGLMAAAELTGKESFASYAHGLFKAWIAREVPRGRFDYTAPGAALLEVYERTRDCALLEAALRLAKYCSEFRRSQFGAFIRDESDAAGFQPDLPDDLPGRCRLQYQFLTRVPSCSSILFTLMDPSWLSCMRLPETALISMPRSITSFHRLSCFLTVGRACFTTTGAKVAAATTGFYGLAEMVGASSGLSELSNASR